MTKYKPRSASSTSKMVREVIVYGIIQGKKCGGYRADELAFQEIVPSALPGDTYVYGEVRQRRKTGSTILLPGVCRDAAATRVPCFLSSPLIERAVGI